MMAQQTNVDVIANNLANVNTIGYKSQSAEFKSLLYQDLQAKTTSANGENKPVSGLGVRPAAIVSSFTQGALLESSGAFDYAIEGEGFFMVRQNDGTIGYTRNGNFFLSVDTDGTVLCTAEGYPVLSSEGQPIVLDPQYQSTKITVDGDGNICYPDESNNAQPIGIKIGLYQFPNPSGLTKVGNSYLAESDASGVAINEEDGVVSKSKLKQGYLESSNVNVATEMVNLITAQRAYELCSKAITTSDTMMEQANNLKR